MKLLLRRACRSLNSFTMIPARGKQGSCYPSATTALPMKRRAAKRTRVLSHLPYSILCIKLGSTNLSQEHTLGTAMACCHLPLATRQDHGYSCTACFFSFEPQTLSLVDEGCCCSDRDGKICVPSDPSGMRTLLLPLVTSVISSGTVWLGLTSDTGRVQTQGGFRHAETVS